MLLNLLRAITDLTALLTRLITEELADEQRVVPIDEFTRLRLKSKRVAAHAAIRPMAMPLSVSPKPWRRIKQNLFAIFATFCPFASSILFRSQCLDRID